MEEDDSITPSAASPPSFKRKLKQSLCFCCFRRSHLNSPPPSDHNPTLIWVKSKDRSFSEIKEKCRAMLGFGHKKNSSSMEFGYDPLSYALNFEDGFDCDDEAPLKSFSVRFPPVAAVS